MSNKVYVQVGVKGRSLPVGGNAGDILQKASDDDFDLQWTAPAGGASANIPQPWVSTMNKDTGSGSYGGGSAYASGNHSHPLNVADAVTPSMDGTASAGDDDYYARRDHVHPSNDYPNGLVLDETANIFSSVDNLPEAGTAGRIAFVIVS